MDATDARNDEDETVSLTLMESGSRWPERDVIPFATFENIVMAQHAAETVEAFATRATRRLAHVRAAGRRLESATLVVSRALGKSSQTTHGRLAMLIGGSLSKGGMLTLVAGDRLSAGERAGLANVAATLSEYFGPDGPGIRLVLAPGEDARFAALTN